MKPKILHINATPEFFKDKKGMEMIEKMCELAYNFKSINKMEGLQMKYFVLENEMEEKAEKYLANFKTNKEAIDNLNQVIESILKIYPTLESAKKDSQSYNSLIEFRNYLEKISEY